MDEGLRALHETLPVADGPFDWSVASRIANAERRGIRVPESLRTPPPIDELVGRLAYYRDLWNAT